MQKKNNNYKDTIILGVILITFGITLLFNNSVKTKKEEVFNYMNLSLSTSYVTDEIDEEETEPTTEEVLEQEIVEEVKEEVKEEVVFEPYIAVLRIPKVNLERGFYDKNSSLNNLKRNMLFHKNSNYPDEVNGNVIIASHSGSASYSYFKNLYKLELGDYAYIDYNNKTYTYKIVNIYYEDKDGSLAIYRDSSKSTLTLITCTYKNKTKQTVYILELI